jgi:hypothetical protein
MSGHDPQTTDKQSSALGMMARLWWMLLGNAILALSIVFVVENKEGFFHTADWVFWITVATLILVRYLDIRLLDGTTATGAHATTIHWVKYVALLAACTTAVWALAHAANYWLVSRIPAG